MSAAPATRPPAVAPPQNLEAEESVLGAMLLSATADRRRHRDPRRGRLLPRPPRRRSTGRASRSRPRASRSTRSRSRTSSTSAASSSAVGGRRAIAELAALVPATSNAEHYARIVKEMATLRGLVRAGQEIARLGQDRPGETTDLVDRAEQIVFDLAQQRVTGDFAHIEHAAQGELRADHAPLRGGRRRHRHPDRLPRPRQAHVRLPARQPRHPRRPAVDGEVRARALHRRQPRRARRACRWRCSRSRCRRPR